MKLTEIISTVKNLRANGKPSDDRGYSDAQYKFIIDYYRATLIRNQQAKKQSLNEFLEQEIEVILAPKGEIHVSSSTVPSPIELANGDTLTYFGDCDGDSYQRIRPNRSKWVINDKYTYDLPKWYMRKNHIEVLGSIETRKCKLRGIFEDPLAVMEYNKEDINPLSPYDVEYPMSSTMIGTMIKMMIDAELRFSMVIPSDTSNDGKDS